MNKFTLKPYFLAVTAATIVMSSAHAHAESMDIKKYVHTCVDNVTQFINFSLDWTEEFFSKNSKKPYLKCIEELQHATRKFEEDAQALKIGLQSFLQNTPYTHAMTVADDIVSGLLTQAKHVASILDKNRQTKNAFSVGLALKKTEQYTSIDAINLLQKKFIKFKDALVPVDVTLAQKINDNEQRIIARLKRQHKRGYAELISGLSHRIKC